jgi:polysaccharide export outer membrane protein
MNKYLPKLIILLIASVLVSCVTSKKLTYLQYEGTPSDTIISVTPSDYKILPFDNLFIRVVTPDPKWSEMFNTLPVTSSGISFTELSADLVSYPVNAAGTILLPYLGRIEVAGKTLAEVTTELEKALKGYIADAAVTVKMVNNYVSLLGEIKNPGKYPIYKDRLNIFQALAMGGDLGDFSNRQKVQIIRQISGGQVIKEFCLTDRSVMTSEFFYVMPNDVIYAMPMKGRFFKMNEFPYTVILGTITTFLLMWNVVK